MKKIFRFLFIIAGSFLLVNAIAMPFMTNFNIGVIPQGIFAIIMILYGVFFDKREKIFHVMMCGISAVLIIFSAGLAIYGVNDTSNFNEDVLIVLGAAVEGEKVSLNLEKRLDKAVEYHQKNPDAKIIVSGGMGDGEDISEALAMERYLVERGVPSEIIIKEDKSTSTRENFIFSSEYINADEEVVFITNYFHIFRAEMLAKSAGINAKHLGANIYWYSAPMNYIREMMAVAKDFVIK